VVKEGTKAISYGRQSVNQADIDAVVEVLRSEYLTQGPIVPRFEKAVSEYCGAHFGVAVNSATSALHIACLALGVGEDDTVWTVPNTFVASANCARYCGANVDFVDIDPYTWCMDVARLEEKLIDYKQRGVAGPKVVIPVHFAGLSCDMASIYALSKEFGFRLIEDASHAIGGEYCGSRVGSCEFSDITVFSFHPVKIITTGEGGMALTKNPDLQEKMRQYRNHGITRNPDLMTRKNLMSFDYEQCSLGFNYRMSDMHAALGLSQLTRIDEFVETRNLLAKRYNEALMGIHKSIRCQVIPHKVYSARHLYAVRVPKSKRCKLIQELVNNGISTNIHYRPVHLQPYYHNLGFKNGDFPEAEIHGETVFSLPLFPDLPSQAQTKVVRVIRKVLT
jgi:UDP-4-amino-4,6-dideoxy-N-acetyl-beta-L-altrosamine transaminase